MKLVARIALIAGLALSGNAFAAWISTCDPKGCTHCDTESGFCVRCEDATGSCQVVDQGGPTDP